MTELTLTVPQGIGDAYWVYQTFARHCDKIRFITPHVPGVHYKLATRATEFLLGLPKVQSVSIQMTTKEDYDDLASRIFTQIEAQEILRTGAGRFACNGTMETGVRLESICPDLEVEWEPDLPLLSAPPGTPDRYWILYVSECASLDWHVKAHGSWTCEQWAEFVTDFSKRTGLDRIPCLMIGAEYDRISIQKICSLLPNHDIRPVVGEFVYRVAELIKNATMFIGYQGGLKCIADRYNTPQVTIWFPALEKLRFSFPKMTNIESHRYQAFLFSQSPQEVAQAIQCPIPT